MVILAQGSELAPPSEADATTARASGRALAPHVGVDSIHVLVRGRGGADEVVLPPTAARLLLDILTEMGRGNAVAVAAVRPELTTEQAAELLDVPLSHLTTLLDGGVFHQRTVGGRPRLPFAEVLAFKQQMLARRHAALDELSALDQEFGLYDGPRE